MKEVQGSGGSGCRLERSSIKHRQFERSAGAYVTKRSRELPCLRLVSWNFRHIVNYDKIRLFNAVNIENGLKSIDIYSPREVTYYEE